MPRPRAVLFDLDHTLLDTDRAERAALRAALAGVGCPWSEALLRTYRRINGEMWAAYQRGEIDPPSLARERFCRLLGEMGRDAAQGGLLGTAYLDALAARGDLVRGARAALLAVSRRARVAAVTNGIDKVQHDRLRAAGIAGRFEVVVTSEACGYVKPDPRILREALNALAVDSGDAVYVGDDARVDGGAARAAGVAFWWIDRGSGGPPPDAMARRLGSVREVPALLDAEG